MNIIEVMFNPRNCVSLLCSQDDVSYVMLFSLENLILPGDGFAKIKVVKNSKVKNFQWSSVFMISSSVLASFRNNFENQISNVATSVRAGLDDYLQEIIHFYYH